jgi:hypothetical protein
MCATCPAHLILLYLITLIANICSRVQIMNLLTARFSPPSWHFILLRSRYCPKHPVLRHPSLSSSLNVRDKFHPPYKINKIIVLYAVIFTFLDLRKYRRFWTAFF